MTDEQKNDLNVNFKRQFQALVHTNSLQRDTFSDENSKL